jgi:tRNA(adenine34) deaminase
MGSLNNLLNKIEKAVNCRPMNHAQYMQMAIEEALRADRIDEVPIGAVIVGPSGAVLARDHNRTISNCDPSAHAEMNVLRTAARVVENYRLLSTTLYVTMEPCAMCMGAIVHARVAQVVFGAFDTKWGAAGSLYQLGQDPRLNHQVNIVSGICADQCRQIIQDFFRRRRDTC